MATKHKTKSGTIYYNKKTHSVEEIIDYIMNNKPTQESIENQHCEWVEAGGQVCSLFGCTYNKFVAERKVYGSETEL